MKSFFRLIFIGAITIALVCIWLLFTDSTSFNEKSSYVFIVDSSNAKDIFIANIKEKGIIKYPFILEKYLNLTDGWKDIKPGKYEIKKGQSIWRIARTICSGRIAEMKLVINHLRTKEDFAKLVSKNFSSDSSTVMTFINSPDSIKQWKVDTSNLFTLIIPDTYSFYWNVSLNKIFEKLAEANTNFWNKNDRKAKAAAMHLTEKQVYILASIVDEETNYESDKYKIASVYINRLQKQMPLQACPTIKYAMKDFTLTRIYEKYLTNPSPYNTYRHKGLPPGPICTPMPKTIDIVLDAPKTNYLFFVAKSDFSGYHHFSSTFTEHNTYAKEYQKALDIYMAEKQKKGN